ncbi:MAG: hypothetical protein CL946_13580, partial [Ectothiorhodospiraceae bacterium]|nr:hypothetical protein [Ectothiorhodospiraceae bacterium]
EVVDEIDIPEVSETREAITTRAIERNSVYRIAVQQYNIADDGVGLASSVFYPRLSLGASYGYNDRTASSSRPDFPADINTETREASVGLTLSFNIFNGFRDRIDLQNAKIQRMNEELAVLDEENRVRGLVSERYDTYLKRKETAELEAENLNAAEQNLKLMQERYDLGTATSLEFRDAQINAARARTTLIAARYQARIAHLQLQQLMGEIEVGTIVEE